MNSRKKNILVIMGRYLPGYKDGGPVRTIKNLVDFLGEEYNFKILTCDRDHGDTESYPGVKIGVWNKLDNEEVFYVPPGQIKIKLIKELASQCDLIYVCGCFSDYAIKTMLLLNFKNFSKPVVIASMGLFSDAQMSKKSFKKKLFINLMKFTRVNTKIIWSATSQTEKRDIERYFKNSNIYIAKDLPRLMKEKKIYKEKKKLKVIFISRVCEHKNLKLAIEVLTKVKLNVVFTIYGPIHDNKYWNECDIMLNKLPENICWNYGGELASDNVISELEKHHVLLFPSKSENYGHVIHEALFAGCPCIIGPNTPWRDIESRNVGFICELENTNKFINAIEYYSQMEQREFNSVVERCNKYAYEHILQQLKNSGYRKLFDDNIL